MVMLYLLSDILFSGIQLEMLGFTQDFFKALKNFKDCAYFALCTQLFAEIFCLDTHLKLKTVFWSLNMRVHHAVFCKYRVRATDRHCRKMRRNNKFGAKNINLATTIGERKIASKCFVWRRNRHLRLQVIASCRLVVINVYLNCQLTPQLSTKQFSS